MSVSLERCKKCKRFPVIEFGDRMVMVYCTSCEERPRKTYTGETVEDAVREWNQSQIEKERKDSHETD